jgi:hypothetical protein
MFKKLSALSENYYANNAKSLGWKNALLVTLSAISAIDLRRYAAGALRG